MGVTHGPPKKSSNLLGDSESDSLFVSSQPPMGTPHQVARHNAFALGNGMGEIGEESGEGLAVEVLMRPVVCAWYGSIFS